MGALRYVGAIIEISAPFLTERDVRWRGLILSKVARTAVDTAY